MKILWGITGAGHLLKESIDVLEEISDNHEVTLIFSKAGYEVVQLYHFKNKIDEIISKNDKNKIINEEKQEYSYPFSGKLTHHKYDLIVISPTTANTTAKVVHGIADTLITNVIAQSGKGQIPTIIVPVDQEEGIITTTLPSSNEKIELYIRNIDAENTRKISEIENITTLFNPKDILDYIKMEM